MDCLNNFLSSKTFVVVILFIVHFPQNGFGNSCVSKETCGKCIAEAPFCAWCTEDDFSESGGPRCDIQSNLLTKCESINIVSPEKSEDIVTDESLSDKGAKEDEAIQIKPQEIRLRLRPNSIHRFNVEFRQAVDYPVDLYYLMDLSHSMNDDKDKLAELGNKLAQEMESITNNFKLGFGSFVDKKTAPYVDSQPAKLKEPCPNCATPYGFRNHMPLSSKTREFARKVKDAKISGNLDAPEGGFDAIMQAIVCKNEIGWRNKSRKLLIFSTDNSFHFAGDGKLGGIILPNDEKCHLDADGYYTMSTQLDYPSLSQINRQIKDHKINIIFAVTKDQVELYETLSRTFTGSSTGRLEKDSSNVVDFIRQQYDKITSAVEMTDDVDDSNIRISYFSSCLGEKKEKTNICKELKVGTHVTFEVTMEFSFCPKNKEDWQRTFHIFPVGLQDYLTIHLEMICECDCEKPGHEEVNSPKCSGGNGTFECGICSCNSKRYGKECECDASDSDPLFAVQSCFNGDDAAPCSGQGTCLCGRCYCHQRPNAEEKTYGKYCECNNFSCDKHNGKICNGPDHGVCDCGVCLCLKDWGGEDCSCKMSTESCMGYNGEICSGHGKCVCGSCICDSTEEDYFGTLCDDCATCPGKCDELRECVECFIEGFRNCTSCESLTILPTDSIEVKGKEKLCTFIDSNRCRLSFKYAFNEENKLVVWTIPKRECPVPVDVVSIVAGLAGGIVATGLFLLLLWKGMTVVHDRRELARFEKEILTRKWNQGENPLYKEVQTTYRNPAYRGDCSEFSELTAKHD